MPASATRPCVDQPCDEPRAKGQARCLAHLRAYRARKRAGDQATAPASPEAAQGPPEPLREPVTDAKARAQELAAQDGATGVAGTRLLRDIEREQRQAGGGGDTQAQMVLVRGFFFRGQDREERGNGVDR